MTIGTHIVSVLLNNVGFDLLGEDFGAHVERVMSAALKADAVFPGGRDTLTIFQNTLATSIRDIENDKRDRLFKRFLRDGPIPPELQRPETGHSWHVHRIDDAPVKSAIREEGLLRVGGWCIVSAE